MKKAITLVMLLFGAVTAMAQTWQNVGSPGFSAGGAGYNSLALDPAGIPYVAYRDSSNDSKATVMKFNGTSWETVGEPGFSASSAYWCSLEIDSEGVPYVAYWEGESETTTVMKFNGTAWESVGPPQFVYGGDFLSFTIDANDVPYVAFSDWGNGMRATVMKFNGTSWEYVGIPGFSLGDNINTDLFGTSLAVDSAGTPYLAYTVIEYLVEHKLTVMKFNGTSWQAVGATEFSAGEVQNIDLTFDANDVPYVAYTDIANNYKATVMKFNGTSWLNVGTPGFTGAAAYSPSLMFDLSGNPNVAFQDQSNGFKASVMKFNGTSWNYLGTPGFSEGIAGATSLAFNASGTAYVGYSDGENGGKASVMKLVEVVCENCALTQLAPAYCNITIAEFSDNLAAVAVPDAQQYRFRASDGTTATIVTRNDTTFRIDMLPTYNYNTVYTIDVAVKVDDQWSDYGTACTVTTPPVCEGCSQTTELAPEYCGITIAQFSDDLAALPVETAQQYRFRVTDGTITNTVTRNDTIFRVNMLPYYTYNTTYTIDVAVKIDDEWSAYGTACTVTTPPVKLAPAYCGITIAQFTDDLAAIPVPTVQQYRFRVTDGSTANIITRNNNIFRVNMLPSYAYNKTYTIDVAVKIDDVWSDYGPTCTVATPAPPVTQLRPQDCGTTVASFGTGISATAVPLAEGYRFRVTIGTYVQTVDRPDNSFRLNQLVEYNYVTTYQVAVAVKINGVYGPYGPTCNVTSPAIPLTQLNPGFCNITIEGFNYGIYANAVSQAEAYRFRVTNGANVQIITNGQFNFRLNQLSNYQYAITYTVEVAVRINNVYGAYGNSCTVTAPPYPLTKLTTASCGSTLSSFDTPLLANTVYLAESYRFKITNGANVQILNRSVNHFRLDMLPSYQYGVTYTVEVATLFNGAYGPYGPACTVNAPAAPLTQLNNASCNTTVDSFNTSLNAISVASAEGYRFRVVNGANVQTIEGTNSYFRLNQLESYQYDTTYTVTVAIKTDGVYGPYGPACTVTSPAAQQTQLNSASCGITVPGFNTNLYATTVPSVTGYRFRVANGASVQTIEGSASYFRLNQLGSYQYSTVYTVDVAVSVGGVYGAYGPACTVTTPAPPVTQLRAQDCGITVAGFGTNLYADEVILAEGYRFRVMHGATTDIVDRPNRNFRIKMLPSYTYNTTYSIEVAVLIDGVYGPYGAACEVSTPASGTRQNMANDEESVRELTAFPNPYETSFTLLLETESNEPVHIQAYDIMGKILDNSTVSPEELSGLRIGENYAAGIYSIIVSQGSYTKVVKMVKK
ncbi:T9SS type A sorting domain-containing protein [Flavobacterium sp. DGU11]|uniref:T9SS type A sorting domain-containing protein n=1 Tax=Flavobacterium arundinis TaxID=3139143 RepID=A0ABU9HSG6_9FLAO